MSQITILIVDDHSLIRQGFRNLLSNVKGFSLVGAAENGEEALILIKKFHPNVVITDISMPGISGLELTEKIVKDYSNSKVLVISNYIDAYHVNNAYKAGALGFIPKSSEDHTLLAAIKQVGEGKQFYTRETLEIIGSTMVLNGKYTSKPLLTDRENEVLYELVNGLTNKEVAEKLYVSIRTVDAHRRNIMSKLKVKNIAQLIRKVHDDHLI